MNRITFKIFALFASTALLAACGDGGTSGSAGSAGKAGSSGAAGTAGMGGTAGAGGTMAGAGGTMGGAGGMMSGSGGSGGSMMMLVDQCKNAADGAILMDPAIDIGAITGDCGKAHIGDEAATKQCIIDATKMMSASMMGISDGCATCFAQTVSCIVANCLNECIADANSQPCLDCRAKNCDPAFAMCSGLMP